jgi:hypothetical protein
MGRCDVEGGVMTDLLYVAITIVFFVLALAYVVACERLE